MKKLLLLAVSIILFTSLAHAQANWVNFKIDSKVSVKMPVTPTVSGDNTWLAKGADSTIYLVVLVDFVKVANIDSVALNPLLPGQQFADGLKTGMLGKMPGSTLGDVKIGKWKGHYTYTMDGANVEKKIKLYCYMVVIGNIMYSTMAILPEKNDIKGKDYFFSSLALN